MTKDAASKERVYKLVIGCVLFYYNSNDKIYGFFIQFPRSIKQLLYPVHYLIMWSFQRAIQKSYVRVYLTTID